MKYTSVIDSDRKQLLTSDLYQTPATRKRSFLDRLLFGARWAFHIKNFYVCCKTGQAGKRGLLDSDAQAFYSYQNLKVAEACGARINIKGLDNIAKPEGPIVLIGNHMSQLETVLLSSFINPRKPSIFVVKQALFDVPFFGDTMRGMGNIGVGRDNPREDFKKVIVEGKQKLEEGISIIIFPQSTRSSTFEPANFNSIGVKLAKAAGVPIVPFALKTDFLGNGKWIKDLGPVNKDQTVYFEFGDPIQVEGNGKKELSNIIDFIQACLEKWQCD